jgi:hypothetical protein
MPGVIERNPDRARVLVRHRVTDVPASDTHGLQMAGPGVLQHIEQVATGAKQIRDRQLTEGVDARKHGFHVRRQLGGQFAFRVVDLQQLAPQVGDAANQWRTQAENMEKDKLLRRRFAKDLGGMVRLRFKELPEVLWSHLPRNPRGELRQQIRQAESNLPAALQVIPRESAQVVRPPVQDHRLRWTGPPPLPLRPITTLEFGQQQIPDALGCGHEGAALPR